MYDKITVIVPVYNLEEYLERSVESICNQIYKNLEIILVNDGSKDNSLSIMKTLANRDNRIRIIDKENGGVTKARLEGIKFATGTWIGFVDGDDFIETSMYEKLLKNAYKYNAQISHCGYRMIFPEHVDYYYNTGKIICQDNKTGIKDLLEGTFVEPGLCNKLFHKNLFQSLLEDEKIDFSIKNYEDLLMNFYLFKNASISIYEDCCPYYYILRKDSAATGKISWNKLEDPLKVLKTIKKELNDDELINIIDSRILMNLIGIATISYDKTEKWITECKLQAKSELKDLLKRVDQVHIGKKVILSAKITVLSPRFYELIHKLYSRVKGTYKKYEI